jgi:hypothetical protein
LQTQPVTGSGVPVTSSEGGPLSDLFDRVPGARELSEHALEQVQQSAYAQGKTGGGVLKELMDRSLLFGTDLRQNEISNLLATMGYGQGAATSTGQIGANTAANVSNTMMNAASARASGYANNPWVTGLGAVSGFFAGEGGENLLKSAGEWWKRRRPSPRPGNVPSPIGSYF